MDHADPEIAHLDGYAIVLMGDGCFKRVGIDRYNEDNFVLLSAYSYTQNTWRAPELVC
jgi:hypothetical protein